jgi:predicted DCC family thiol-disulfide oxidoreductase YuxK
MTQAEQNAIEGRALLLYDGICPLCNGVVQFLLKHDRRDVFRFVPLQSELGREVLYQRLHIHNFPDGVILVTDTLTPAEQFYRRSDAVTMALPLLGGGWLRVSKAVGLIPRGLREWVYGIISRLRYYFGRYKVCPVPPLEQRSRMLGVYE